MNNYAKYSSIAIETVAIMLLGVWGGVKLDEKFKTEPFLTLALSVVAIFIAIYSMIKKLKK